MVGKRVVQLTCPEVKVVSDSPILKKMHVHTAVLPEVRFYPW